MFEAVHEADPEAVPGPEEPASRAPEGHGEVAARAGQTESTTRDGSDTVDDPTNHSDAPWDEPHGLDPLEQGRPAWVEALAWRAVDEVEASHERERVDDAGPEITLDLAVAAARAERLAQARQLSMAAHWADLHPTLDPALSPVVPGAERLVQLGGDGTPALAEFAPAELGAVLSITASAAATLIADALDLRHRLPMLWTRVQAGEVRPWTARQIAERTRRLSSSAAASVDRRITRLSDTLAWGRLRKLVDAAILAADPPQALSDTEQAEADRGVWVSDQLDHGVGTVFAKATAGDLHAFETAISLIARALRTLGDPDSLDIRRSKALGIIADPQTALALVADAEARRKARLAAIRTVKHDVATQRQPMAATPGPDALDSDQTAETGETGETLPSTRKPFTWGTATLYLHVTKADLDGLAKHGIVRAEDIGPLLLDQVRRWLQHRQVLLKPIIDPETIPPVDRYEAPAAMTEALILTNPADFFPHSPNISRRMDGEHVVPYVPQQRGGPPGQTALDKLARTGRHNHRVKTHSRWAVRRLADNAGYLWRSPHGHRYLVNHYGTTNLGRL